VQAVYVVFWLLFCCLSCSISEKERCGNDFYFEAGNCYPNSVVDTDTGPIVIADSGAVDGGATELGLGLPCDDQPDCAAYQADYCILNPTDPSLQGSCTVKGCTTQPDNCPGDYQCCDFPALADGFYGGHDICLPAEGIQEVIDQLGSCEG